MGIYICLKYSYFSGKLATNEQISVIVGEVDISDAIFKNKEKQRKIKQFYLNEEFSQLNISPPRFDMAIIEVL